MVMLDSLDPDGCGDMGFAGAWTADQNDIVGVLEEVAAMELAHQCLVDATAGEVEAIGVAIGWKACCLELIGRRAHFPLCRFGSEDFALTLGGVPDPDVLRQPKLMVHYAAKAAGKLSLGLLRSIADYSDLPAIEAAATEARRHGFDGATCVHPSAVPILNTAFAPSPADLAWARAVLATTGTVSLNGQMIDKPLRGRATAILRAAGISS